METEVLLSKGGKKEQEWKIKHTEKQNKQAKPQLIP